MEQYPEYGAIPATQFRYSVEKLKSFLMLPEQSTIQVPLQNPQALVQSKISSNSVLSRKNQSSPRILRAALGFTEQKGC